MSQETAAHESFSGLPCLMIVEGDSAHVQHIQHALDAYAIQVEVVNRGEDALQEARRLTPVLILLRVELPDVSGYAICNKLKKSPQLATIPVIIMSSEATPETFERHRKLRTRAEDYVDIPTDMAALVEKITQFVELPRATEVTSIDQLTALRVESMEPVIEEGPYNSGDGDVVIEDEYSVDDNDAIVVSDDEEPQLPTANLVEMDEESQIAEETEAAFAALEIEESVSAEKPVMIRASKAAEMMGQAGGPLETRPTTDVIDDVPEENLEEGIAQKDTIALDNEYDDQHLSDLEVEPLELQDEIPPQEAIVAGNEPMELQEVSAAIELADADDITAVPQLETQPLSASYSEIDLETPSQQVSMTAQTETEFSAKISELNASIEMLQKENSRLRDENAELRSRTVASSSSESSGSGDVFQLKEDLLKKRKEIINLTDGLDAKEREVLAQREKVRDLERTLGDLEEKMLGIERSLAAANSKIEALERDKKAGMEREAGVKARLDEAKAEINKAYAENKEQKQKHDQAMARAQEQHTHALEHALTKQREAEEKLKAEFAQRIAAEQEAHLAKIGSIEESHRIALEQADSSQRDAIDALKAEHRQNLDRLTKEHSRAIEQVQTQAQSQAQIAIDEALARAKQEQQTATETLGEEHARALAQLRQEHEATLQTHRDQHREELSSLEAQFNQAIVEKEAIAAAAKEELRVSHQAQLDRLRKENDEKLAQALERLEREKNEEASMQRNTFEEQIASLTKQQATVEEQLSDQLEQRAVQIKTLEHDLAATANTLAERSAEIEKLEHRLLEFRRQRDHEHELAEKAKRAMAIAITLLDAQEKTNGSSTHSTSVETAS